MIMKMIKRFSSIFLVCLMTLAMIPATVFAANGQNEVMIFSSDNGRVVSSHQDAWPGELVTLYVYPDSGYTLETLEVLNERGQKVTTNGTSDWQTFTMPEGHVEVVATFMDNNAELGKAHFIRIRRTEHGTVSVDPDYADLGTVITVTVTPDNGYKLSRISFLDVNGKDITPKAVNERRFVFEMPASDIDVVPVFESDGSEITYSVTAASASHGKISVSPSNAKQGSTISVTAVPDTGYTLETLTVMDAEGRKLTVNGSGNPRTFTLGSSNVTVSATFMDDNTMLNFFTDVAPSDYFYNAVLWAVGNGITSGISSTAFGATGSCTRADLVTFLWRAAGKPTVSTPMNFRDVASNAYYAEAVRWASSLGIVTGFGDGRFGSHVTVNREQVVSILYRYAITRNMDVDLDSQTNILSYHDASSVSEYAMGAFQWGCGSGIVQGSNGFLNPKNGCTRAQIVSMLYRLLG